MTTIKSGSFPKADTSATPLQRIASIDILRALTMVLMIFVNDFWSLKNIPDWLKHVERGVDGIGLSDIVFPAFLFIVGFSLPYAIQNRRKKGDDNLSLIKHVLFRTIALLIMGVFFVNGESINAGLMGIPTWLWGPLCCLCFILIWNAYPENFNKILTNSLKVLGILVLTALAIYYRGGENGDVRFQPHWWGILGLIGWAYLVSSLITIFAKNNFYWLLAGWVFFSVLSMVNKAGMLQGDIFYYIPAAILGGTLPGLTMGGVLASFVFSYYVKKKDNKSLTLVFLLSAVALVILSILTRPYWGLAKLGATPAWLFLCSAFTLLAFTLIYWIADVWKKAYWFNFVKPAGTDTLLCYLMPFFLYAAFRATGFEFPDILINGGIGLLKSLFIALLCVLMTRWLNAVGVRLKI